MSAARPFFPKDKPKSWVVFISAILVAILIGGPLMFLGPFLDELGFPGTFISVIGRLIFVASCVTSFVMWFVLVAGWITGRHKDIQPRHWRDQVW